MLQALEITDSASGNAEAFLVGATVNMTQSLLTPEISVPGITKIHKSSKLLDFLSQKHGQLRLSRGTSLVAQ